MNVRRAMREDVTPLNSFSTVRLRAERLTPAHLPDLRRMDRDEGVMAMLGGVRDAVGTLRYLDRNLAHWEEHGFGIWMQRDWGTKAMVGRALLPHLEAEGVAEVESGYGFFPEFSGRGRARDPA